MPLVLVALAAILIALWPSTMWCYSCHCIHGAIPATAFMVRHRQFCHAAPILVKSPNVRSHSGYRRSSYHELFTRNDQGSGAV
ncbi:hypothetical protein OBBRIDRAFT_798881 [Obba rivulosa]|uniref:Secreted peptide n=1 Tax=Obba rivulosa TaxID=1052685 RepID=A0A8E2AIC1_9APHY|nr:hypothetical protein OBBRIDRAFT_798881 [Obba rivulosa]